MNCIHRDECDVANLCNGDCDHCDDYDCENNPKYKDNVPCKTDDELKQLEALSNFVQVLDSRVINLRYDHVRSHEYLLLNIRVKSNFYGCDTIVFDVTSYTVKGISKKIIEYLLEH